MTSRPPLMLTLESSCDETAAAIVDSDLNILSSIVATQEELHARFGGVVPEIAARAHLERVLPVIDEALRKAQVTLQDLSAIGVVTQPGLVGSLLVGFTAAKSLAMVLDLPLVSVNHIEAHIYACRMAAGREVFPAIGLVVSGGHTNLYDCRAPLDFELLGATTDDAAGEAFDKVASMLGLPYPGGPVLEKVAQGGNPRAYAFPRSFIHEARLEFSFSGLKTAVLYQIQGQPPHRRDPATVTPQVIADVAASFQEAVVDVLIQKCRQALRQRGRKTLCVGGGVAANGRFRAELQKLAAQEKIEVLTPPLNLCTDNAAMAAIGWEALKLGRTITLDSDVVPGLVR
ncbi:MAG: tRNA (adenosine(37)-N6)-threonylcarbamoyltransferase complex transferase subunit TsaD [Planctomycetota bacterium]